MQFHKINSNNTNEILHITDKRKVTIIRNHKTMKDGAVKIYYNYQILLDQEFLKVLVPGDATGVSFYLVKINNIRFEIVYEKPADKEDYILLSKGLATSNEKQNGNSMCSYILPKKFIGFLKYYDGYNDLIIRYNDAFNEHPDLQEKLKPLYFTLNLVLSLDDNGIVHYKLFLEFSVAFIEYYVKMIQLLKDNKDLSCFVGLLSWNDRLNYKKLIKSTPKRSIKIPHKVVSDSLDNFL